MTDTPNDIILDEYESWRMLMLDDVLTEEDINEIAEIYNSDMKECLGRHE